MLPDGDGLQLTRELKRRDPALEVLVITAYGSVRKAMEATKGAGAFHVLEKPFEPDELLVLLENALEHRKLVGENADLKRRLVDQVTDTEILGSAPGIQRVLETVAAVADADANVLIVGESGTGKELLANALHEQSHRRGGPWIKINCAALPKDLIESELFGHTRGAFTGATTDKVGLLEEADGGSLLLDEITEMPIDLQAKLLRVARGANGPPSRRRESRARRLPPDQLDQPEPRRARCATVICGRTSISGSTPCPSRCRLYGSAATTSRFWSAPSSIAIAPSTRARWRASNRKRIDGCSSWSWPGNIRELQHAIERAVLVTRGPMIVLEDLPEQLQHVAREGGLGPSAVAPSQVPAGSLEEIERASILKALETTRWNKQAAAALLGLRRPTLYSKMRKHGIPQRRG